jgi:methyl-accepting chemotaxis protein
MEGKSGMGILGNYGLSSGDLEARSIRLSQAVIEFDVRGNILTANDLFLKAVGYSLEEIVGQHHSLFMDPADRDGEAYRGFWKRLADGEAFQAEALRCVKGGARIWLQAVYTPIRDRAGRVVKVVKYASDITAQKKVLADLEGQIAAIGKSQAAIEFDLKGNILNANANFLAVTGYSLAEIVGRHHSLFVTEEERKSEAYRHFWERIGRGDYDQGQYRRVNKSGGTFWIQASYNPVMDALGRPWKVVKYASDITAAKETEFTLKHAIDEIQKAVRATAERDLTRRVAVDGMGGDILVLCDGVNALIDRFAEMTGAVSAITSEIDHAAREISSGAEDLSKRTDEQATSLEETAATTEQLAASVKLSAHSARQAAATAQEAAESATAGGAIAQRAVDAMARIEDASRRISEIVRVIDDIAFQTNLLALNAAVEAARAGDAGKGFAVVASEVRTLAQRAGVAAKDISALISSSNAEVVEGVGLVRKAGESLAEILESTERVASTISEISAASGEQAHGIEEMSQTVAQLDQMTQANAALSEQSAAAANSLAGRIAELNGLVSGFRTNVPAASRPDTPGVPARADAAPARLAPARAASSPGAGDPWAQPARKVVNARGASSGWAEF